MYCNKCGSELNDDAVVCVYCGCEVPGKKNKEFDEPKTGMGVLLGLFLGIVGLLIGILLYPAETVARKTFIKAWLITFFVSLGIAIIFYILIFAIVVASGYGTTI